MNFMELVRKNKVYAEDIDNFIDEWHNGAGEGSELHEFLGMSRLEYSKWVESSLIEEDQ